MGDFGLIDHTTTINHHYALYLLFGHRVIGPILVRSEEGLEEHQSPVKAVTRQVTFVPVVQKRLRVDVVQDTQRH